MGEFGEMVIHIQNPVTDLPAKKHYRIWIEFENIETFHIWSPNMGVPLEG